MSKAKAAAYMMRLFKAGESPVMIRTASSVRMGTWHYTVLVPGRDFAVPAAPRAPRLGAKE